MIVIIINDDDHFLGVAHELYYKEWPFSGCNSLTVI